MLLVLSVADRAMMDLMGWSKIDIAQRYMHVPNELRRHIATQVDELLWNRPKNDDEDGTACGNTEDRSPSQAKK